MKNRIQKLMTKENLTPVQFAELVGIQRSAVSHLVTGRNKPSLEVIQKILTAFNTLNPNWLILGIEPMYGTAENHGMVQRSLFEQSLEEPERKVPLPISAPQKNKKVEPENIIEKEKTKSVAETYADFEEKITKPYHPPLPSFISEPAKETKVVEKIIVYYSDSTFEEFKK